MARLEARPKSKGYIKAAKDKRTLPTKHVNVHPWKDSKSREFKYDSRDEELARGLHDSTIAWETE